MFPANIIQQAEKDAAAARLADPNRNPFQRAQDFLRTKLAKLTAKPTTKPLTPQQQVQADADAAAKYSRKLAKTKNIKQLRKTGGAIKSIPSLSAAGLGAYGAYSLAGSAGTPGASKMSGLGIGGEDGLEADAPIYSTPLNSVGKYKSREELLAEQEERRNADPNINNPGAALRAAGVYSSLPPSAAIPGEGPASNPVLSPPVVTETKPDLSKPVDFNPYDATIATGVDYEKYIPGYRENPLTAGSMKGDHAFINPRQKAILARKEMLDRSRERKAAEKFTDEVFNKPSTLDENDIKNLDLGLQYPDLIKGDFKGIF